MIPGCVGTKGSVSTSFDLKPNHKVSIPELHAYIGMIPGSVSTK